jgi:hypothetical protein
MKLKITTFLLIFTISLSISAQTEKKYLPTSNELAFPREITQKCFGIKKSQGSITQITQTYGHFNINKSYINKQICIGDKKYEKGIGVHATSIILINLPKPANRFCAEVGLDNNSQTNGHALYKVIFSLESNGKVIWESTPLAVDIPLNGVTEFMMKVRSAGPRENLCHADWANASVVYENNEKVYLDQYLDKISILNELPLSFTFDGAWVEYYKDGNPQGCRYRPWESAINIEAIIEYALSKKQ